MQLNIKVSVNIAKEFSNGKYIIESTNHWHNRRDGLNEMMNIFREDILYDFSVRCLEKNIIRAYYIICDGCGVKDNLCCKCGQSQDAPIE